MQTIIPPRTVFLYPQKTNPKKGGADRKTMMMIYCVDEKTDEKEPNSVKINQQSENVRA